MSENFEKPTLDLGFVTTVGYRSAKSKMTCAGFRESSATSKVRNRSAFTVHGEVGSLEFGASYRFISSNHQVHAIVQYHF